MTFAGFKTWTLAMADLTINEHKRVTPTLQVGDVNERVTVESTADFCKPKKPRPAESSKPRTIQELPLNGRDVIELTELVPGVRYEGRSLSTSCADGNTSSVQGLGHRNDQTEFRVDGVASNAVCDEGSTVNSQSGYHRAVQRFHLELQRGKRPQSQCK